jgi:RNA recognition motif-containing protein
VLLYIGNIPWEATEEEVMAACAAVLQGRVLSFHLVRNFDAKDIIPGSPKRRLHRGFGFLELQDEETAMEAIRKHKRLPIICRNRRLRIDYPKQQLHSSNRSNVVVHSQQKLGIKRQIEHQNILLTSSCSDKMTKSSSAVNADPSERKSPRIFQDQPKEKKTKSSSAVLNAVPSEKKTPIFKDHPNVKKNSINSAHTAPISGQQNSSIPELLDRHVKEKQKTTHQSKKRPRSAIFTTSSAGSC